MMAKPTLQQRYVAALEARGCRRVTARTGKYIVLTRAEETFYFVGSSGAVRYGKNATDSLPVSDTFKHRLLGDGSDINP